MRVLHIGKFFPPHRGGMETFLADLLDEQRSRGIDAAALVHGEARPGDPSWLTRVPIQGHVVYAPVALGFRGAIAKALRNFQPDVLHLHMPNNAVFWLLTLPEARQVPWVVHWHSDVVASRLRPQLRLAYRLYRPFEQAVLAGAERIVATSPAYLKASEPLQPWLDKCAVIPLGLATESIAQVRPADHAALPVDAWRSPDDGGVPGALRLLSIGRLAYYKGFETLIEAVAPLKGVELVIAGDGELRVALQRQIDALVLSGGPSSIRLLGPVSDAAKFELLRGCDVFCLASRERTEAFGMALLEAMAFAKACIASNLAGSGMSWLLSEAQCGICVQTGDVAGWRTAIERLQSDPALRERLGMSGARAMQQRFSIAHCATALSHEYERAGCDVTTVEGHTPQDVLIVIPARNEAPTVGRLVASIIAAGWPNVLVVDDQSTDATADAAQSAGARVLRPVLPVGAWGGMQAGIRHGLAHRYGCVITMDADGQHEVAQLPVLLAMRHDADLVIGAYPQRASRARQWAWTYFRRLAGFELEDLTSGFRLYNRNAMAVLASDEASLLDYQDLGALLMARRAGLRIVEVPVTMNVRVAGKSKIFDSWFSVARYMAVTSMLCMSRWRVRRRSSRVA